jgi:invasion protein IalB
VGQAKKVLSLVLPTTAAQRGIRVTIDQDQPVVLLPHCAGDRCTADYEAAADLIARLKQGETLVLEGIDSANEQMRVTLTTESLFAGHFK